jgi:hypothetical protein
MRSCERITSSAAEGFGMEDEPQVHRLFDAATGREVLVCDDIATFKRLRGGAPPGGGVGVSIDVPPAPVRSVSLELAEYAEPEAVGWRARLGAWGCVALLVAVGGVFVVGLLTVAAWAWR